MRQVILFLVLTTSAAAGPPDDKPAAKPLTQEQSVVKARRARKALSARQRAIRDARAEAWYRQELAAQQKAVRDYQDYVVRMGPIWAAEHANQIQQQRNFLFAEQNRIAKYRADNEIWQRWQLQQQLAVRPYR